ncbi:hypothetical protein FHT77_000994 [Rhizobium sp. BK181]|uniref:hypothetical protein n=1 Tax=Rhizobium sp. BK181 TaxID=2587072 RepID=UPI001616AF73|nr:hypothetical protein [Rhizobium sp. BK181]MBB3315152.1 hypothetical protein [Rhizobium sp. BK181]
MSFVGLGSKRVTARKAHVCVWCGHRILIGARYDRQSGIMDGDFQSNAWHEACLRGFDAYYDETRETEFEPEEHEMPFFALYQLETQTPPPVSRELGE